MKKVLRKLLNNVSYFIGLERFGFLLSNRVFWQANTRKKIISFTFDDGPHPIFTSQILDILETHGVHATFFLIGSNVASHQELTKQIVDAGHQIGNHTFTHPALTKLKDPEIKSEISKTHDAIYTACGVTTSLIRPPYGLFNGRILDIFESTNHKTIIGDVYPRDTTLPGIEKIAARVVRRINNGSVIILHDGITVKGMDRSQTVESLKKLIPTLQERGFRFASLPELMDIDHS